MEMKAFSLASSIFNSIQSIDRSFWYRVPENSISNSISSSSISKSIELIWNRGNIPCFLLLPHLLGKQVQIALLFWFCQTVPFVLCSREFIPTQHGVHADPYEAMADESSPGGDHPKGRLSVSRRGGGGVNPCFDLQRCSSKGSYSYIWHYVVSNIPCSIGSSADKLYATSTY